MARCCGRMSAAFTISRSGGGGWRHGEGYVDRCGRIYINAMPTIRGWDDPHILWCCYVNSTGMCV
eukprot:45257-Eustigmatos_ZCMA.PRE.1